MQHILLTLLFCGAVTSEKTKLHFSFITALTGDSTSSGGIPIIDYALEEINNSSDVLPNYTLHYPEILDSQCSSISALESFLYHFDNESQAEPTYLSTLCCGCSSATIPVAEISHHWNIPHISFASSSTALNDRSRFKSFFRTLPCYLYTPHTVATLMDEFGWKRMAIITQDSSTFNRVTAGLEEIFDERGWELKRSDFNPAKDSNNYEQIFDEIGNDYRIIMINTFEIHAYQFICEAFKTFGQRIFNQEVVLILHARFAHEWWETAHTMLNSTCRNQDVMRALNYSLALTPDTYDITDDPNLTALSGINSERFQNIYNDRINSSEYKNYTRLDFYGSAYDAVWTLAVGLDAVDKWVRNGVPDSVTRTCENHMGDLVTLDQFNYRNKKMGCLLHEAISSINFTGITGQIQFRAEGARPENVMRLRQHRIRVENSVYVVSRPTIGRVMNEDTYEAGSALYIQGGTFEFSEGESYNTMWPELDGRDIPYDGTPVEVVEPIPIGITAAFYLLGCIGLVFAVAALVFNFVFRNRKAVKLGSSNLNFLIIGGSVLMYSSIFIFGSSFSSFDALTKQTVLCNFRIWLFAIGYTLCFAVVLAKQWRIFYIFSNPTPSKKIIKDWMLLIVVAVLVAIDICILSIGTAIPDSRLTGRIELDQELRTTADGINEVVYVISCGNEKSNAWFAVLFVYMGLLQLGAIFMAFTTRKVKIKALNDAKETGLMIYLNSIILTVLIVTVFAFGRQGDAYISIFGIAIFLAATLFLAVVFIPRVVYLVMDPEGQKSLTSGKTPTSQFGMNNSDESTIPDLKARIAELQKRISLMEVSTVQEKNSA